MLHRLWVRAFFPQLLFVFVYTIWALARYFLLDLISVSAVNIYVYHLHTAVRDFFKIIIILNICFIFAFLVAGFVVGAFLHYSLSIYCKIGMGVFSSVVTHLSYKDFIPNNGGKHSFFCILYFSPCCLSQSEMSGSEGLCTCIFVFVCVNMYSALFFKFIDFDSFSLCVLCRLILFIILYSNLCHSTKNGSIFFSHSHWNVCQFQSWNLK